MEPSLEDWKKYLNILESKDDKNNIKNYQKLKDIFAHIHTQPAPRFQKEYEACTIRSKNLFGEYFDVIDLANKPLLSSFLRMLNSFGYFRIYQIVYHVGSANEDFGSDSLYSPTIEKVKWFDVCPLLPEAGTIGWKYIMNHGLVKEESEMSQACIELLMLKLHFYSIIFYMDRFKDYANVVRRNGKKVVGKLFELIKDNAYGDDSMIGLNLTLYNLMIPFTNEDQRAAIIDAIVQNLFKPLERLVREEETNDIYELIADRIITKAHLQDILTSKLLDHLKCNIIRRKRRHSVESSEENGHVTLESLVNDINNSVKLDELLPKTENVKVSSKSLQTRYLSYWVQVVDRIFTGKVTTANSAIKIISVSSTLLVITSDMLEQDLIDELSSIMSKTIDHTPQVTKLYNTLDPNIVIDLTKAISDRTRLFSSLEAPIFNFYKSYISKLCTLRIKSELEKVSAFSAFICDKSFDKNTGLILKFIFIDRVATFFGHLKIPEVFSKGVKLCSRMLRKSIKKKMNFKCMSPNGMNDSSFEEPSEEESANTTKIVAMEAFTSILRIALDQKDQEMLDSYGEMLAKLYDCVVTRLQDLLESVMLGQSRSRLPIDSQLPSLLSLYLKHKEVIQVYLDIDLLELITSSLMVSKSSINEVSTNGESKSNKKIAYNLIKSKLNDLDDRAGKSNNVYHTLINKQYSKAVEPPSIGSVGDAEIDKPCFDGYFDQMKTLSESCRILFESYQTNNHMDSYRRILESTTESLEQCDPLDHTKVLCLFLIIEALIPKQSWHNNEQQNLHPFKNYLPNISCSLFRISKSVELGPSIHVFTRPSSHKSNRGIQCCVYANCIKMYTLIFQNYSPTITNPFVTDAMQICINSNLIQYSKYSTRLHKFFIHLASAIVGLLKSFCIGRKDQEVLQPSMPIFLSVFSNLIRCLIIASDKGKLKDSSKLKQNGFQNEDLKERNDNDHSATRENYEAQLKLLAIDIARTLNTLSSLRIKLVDFAPHLISTYIKDTQRASCLDSVKLHLDEGICRIFNLIDAHQKERQEDILEAGVQRKTVAGRASGSLFEMVHARLDQASREIFKYMHNNYNEFYRYRGKF